MIRKIVENLKKIKEDKYVNNDNDFAMEMDGPLIKIRFKQMMMADWESAYVFPSEMLEGLKQIGVIK